jgi:pyocin large subunit-like protein
VPLTKGFDPTLLEDHFKKHGKDFRATDAQAYEALADDFLGRPLSKTERECVKANGDTIRYNDYTNEYGVIRSDGQIRTFYKPKLMGKYRTYIDYFEAKCKE